MESFRLPKNATALASVRVATLIRIHAKKFRAKVFHLGYNICMGSNYIDNKRFEELIVLYTSGDRDHEEELFSMFDKLITNILMSFKFSLDYDEAKQDCYLLILKSLRNFKPSSGSAFNYFTTVIVNNLKLLFTKNKKYLQKLEDYEQILRDKN
jgi:hypothetical protein